jgi:voltage-gated potassium channel
MSARRRWLEALIRWTILYSIVTLLLELELAGDDPNSGWFFWSELVVAGIFTVEYLVRWVVSGRLRYPLRPMAIIDLLAVVPFYLGFFVDPEALRLLRMLRLVRFLKLDRRGSAALSLYRAFRRIRHEIRLIALAGVAVGLAGSAAVYELEQKANPEQFSQYSDSVWYILTTVTTVGYGDKVPATAGGRLVGAMVMLSGLILFGTFVSLVGGAFVEEIRRGRMGADGDGLPADLMAGETVDPGRVLVAIEEDRIPFGDTATHQDTVRLLERMCRAALGSSQPPT